MLQVQGYTPIVYYLLLWTWELITRSYSIILCIWGCDSEGSLGKFNLKLLRPRETYYQFVDEFITAVTHRWPNVLIQFEDFANPFAHNLLEKYRYQHLVFNDDIQGTTYDALFLIP
jgi:malic enzyme